MQDGDGDGDCNGDGDDDGNGNNNINKYVVYNCSQINQASSSNSCCLVYMYTGGLVTTAVSLDFSKIISSFKLTFNALRHAECSL